MPDVVPVPPDPAVVLVEPVGGMPPTPGESIGVAVGVAIPPAGSIADPAPVEPPVPAAPPLAPAVPVPVSPPELQPTRATAIMAAKSHFVIFFETSWFAAILADPS